MRVILSEENHRPHRIRSVSQWIWAITALIGVGLLSFGALRAHRMVTCGAWPTVDGEIEISEMKRGLLREGSLKYNYRIVYRYHVDNTVHTSDRISFAGRSHSGRKERNIFRIYPKGKRVTVHHHPADPGLAVLEVAYTWAGFQPVLLGLLLTPVAVLGLWRRWPLQTDYLFRDRDPDAPLTRMQKLLGALGILTCLAIAWLWWELIKQYAGR